MTMFQRKRIKEMQERIEAAAAPLEEKVDGFWMRLGKFGAKIAANKWTWTITLGLGVAVLIAAYSVVF